MAIVALVAAVVAPAASAAGGQNTSLCSYSAARGAVPSNFALEACVDGSSIWLRNQLEIPVRVVPTGDIGAPRPRVSEITAVASIYRLADLNLNTLLPGDETSYPIGAGTAQVRIDGAPNGGVWYWSNTLVPFLPVGVAVDTFDGFGTFLFELNAVSLDHNKCLGGKNFIGQAGCHAGYGWDLNFALTRWAAKVGWSAFLDAFVITRIIDTALKAANWKAWVDSQFAALGEFLHSTKTLSQVPSGGSTPSLLRKVAREPNGASWYVDGRGYSHRIPDGGTFNCITGQGIVVVNVAAGVASSLPAEEAAACVNAAAGDIIKHTDGDAYLLTAGSSGLSRRWIPTSGVYRCTQAAGSAVKTVPRYYIDDIVSGANLPSQTCIVRGPGGDAQFINNEGRREWVPDSPTWDCEIGRGVPVRDVSANFVTQTLQAGWHYCYSQSQFWGKVLTHSDGDSSYVHPDNTRTWIPDGPTYECRMRQGKQVVQTRWREYVNAFRDTGWDYCYDINAMKGKILSHPDGDSHYVDSSGIRHWIPSTAVYNCLRGKGIPATTVRWREYINNTPEGAWQTC